ncbi:Vacuolar protein sorting-associated protein 11 -like protein [Collichthys lucidus]|uniref:Vacuolar protein sorting-associated protein 11-like protein n=1 Tax=Collichthys lucidus TaxID=240159 RepID=A0A4U5VAK1_COLLU|nr:Vacuolar protein sorting-associated protein 11 -like protein [Collichthys lucidus]
MTSLSRKRRRSDITDTAYLPSHTALTKLTGASRMAAFLQWRKFVFFDKDTVKDPGDSGKNFALPGGISACDSGRGHIVLGDIL